MVYIGLIIPDSTYLYLDIKVRVMRWDQLMRYRFIEVMLLWEGRLNSKHLMDFFGFARDKASTEINNYIKLAPKNLEYDSSLKAYKPSPDFKAIFTQGHIEEYQQLVVRHTGQELIAAHHFDVLQAPLRNIDPHLVQAILKACRENRRIDIAYLSISAPDYQDRIIAPHALAFDGLRWHVRAWCEKNNNYRDFVLSRFNGIAEDEGPSEHCAEQDLNWKTWVDVVIEPDPRLEAKQRRIIELDYQMEKGQRIIPCRAAMLFYLLRRLRLDSYQTTAEAQQIVLQAESRKQINQYLHTPV